jgi:hypothetical protein
VIEATADQSAPALIRQTERRRSNGTIATE